MSLDWSRFQGHHVKEIKKLTEQIHAYADQVANALKLVGVAIIVGGIVFATWWFIRDGSRTSNWQSAYPNYRSNLGRGILLGLELLVGADIIATITAPLTIMSVGLLAGLVLIRTFLSFSLETVIEGCWPWQRAAKEAARGGRDQR
jgi:uncharacterized membrane protein